MKLKVSIMGLLSGGESTPQPSVARMRGRSAGASGAVAVDVVVSSRHRGYDRGDATRSRGHFRIALGETIHVRQMH
ncbi:hypothetical protein [Bradyrhizobium sp. Cp5.3]|uniref:hypothetical protein n=1 Tax=Bradyrhizobium sp. Cp5.3 TaxID=443598 RepID=UPI0012EB2496|nr:hypothetical protein [Bradyrhizobium sp. Cp5.3]